MRLLCRGVENNQLTTLPGSIGQLPSLAHLCVALDGAAQSDGWGLTEQRLAPHVRIWTNEGQCVRSHHRKFGSNQVTSLPAEIFQAKSLEQL